MKTIVRRKRRMRTPGMSPENPRPCLTPTASVGPEGQGLKNKRSGLRLYMENAITVQYKSGRFYYF